MALDNLSPAIKLLTNFAALEIGRHKEQPAIINTYMRIIDVDKFLKTQLLILDSYEEKHRLAQAAITRLIFFKSYIIKNAKDTKAIK